MNLINDNTKRTVCVFFAIVFLIQCFAGLNISAADSKINSVTQDVELTEMVCRIRNAATGLYLDSYKYTAKTKAKSYLEKYSESSMGQVFHLSPCDDGTYMIIPQNDNGEYAYSYALDTSKDNRIKKTKLASAGDASKFDIVEYYNNRFIFAPAYTNNNKLVMTQSETVTEYKDYYTELQEITQDYQNQLWLIEPIEVESLSVIFTSTKVRLYSTGKFYARKHPYNVFTDDIKWSSSNEEVILVGDDGTWCALGVGKSTVTASVGELSKSFTVTVVDRDAFTWYSQNNIYTSDWDATQLKFLRFYAKGIGTKKFAVDSREPGGNDCWMDEGCGNCAVAMVLNNMGAVKTTGYDFRSGQEGNLVADPYTVALANTGSYGSDSSTSTLSGDPIYMRWEYVIKQFNVDGKTVGMTKIYYPTRNTLKKLLAEHPEGIVVQVMKGTKNHYLVFAECLNPEEKSASKLKFMVCDSAAYNPEDGDYVLFEDSTSYKYEGYRYSDIHSVLIMTTE